MMLVSYECPACGHNEGTPEFVRVNGYDKTYVTCKLCGNVSC